MSSSSAAYASVDSELQRLTGAGREFSALLACNDLKLSAAETAQIKKNYPTIKTFQQVCLDLFYASLAEDGELSRLLLQEVPEGFAQSHHISLSPRLRTTPDFFRTDQTTVEKICEIQTPGSGWGELQILSTVLHCADGLTDPAICVSRDVVGATGNSEPILHHLTDNSSSLVSNTYFIQAIREKAGLRYYGFDNGVRAMDCNYIRTHLFLGLMNENFSRVRLALGERGLCHFDYPPLSIYEQKVLLALPFEKQYAQFFDSSIRDLLPFASIVGPDKCVLASGERLSFEQFSRLPKNLRNYFIKYAGPDPSRNWGSRAVYFAGDSQPRLLALLARIGEETRAGRGCWILQQAVTEERDIAWHTRCGEAKRARLYQRLSSFYGPSGLIGALGTYTPRKKVHGQPDSVLGRLA